MTFKKLLQSLLAASVAVGAMLALPAPAEAVCVSVAPGNGTLALALSGHAGATDYCLSSGTYVVNAALPLEAGDRINSTATSGSIVDAASGVSPFQAASTNSVTLRKLRIVGNDDASSFGVWTGSGWTLDTIEVSHFEVGVQLGYLQSGNFLTKSLIHDNTRYGVIAPGASSTTVSYTSIYANDTGQGFLYDEGGTKFSATHGLVFDHNDVYGNWGNGIWFDESAADSVITNNTAHDQIGISGGDGQGIRDEIGCGSTITGNTVYGNDTGGIDVVGSYGVDVSGNIVSADAAFALRALSDNRAGSYHDGCSGSSFRLQADFADNDVTATAGAGAAVEAQVSGASFAATWTTDMYHGGCTSALWTKLGSGAVAFAAWQDATHDSGGGCS